ncbi:MAG: type I-MYXAN CRISPR-associated protein Cas6/Cmx6, partial [Pseudomonadota bacterium]|nr:type I-MYXAN CRISPR-associated protein Cas6/Cmx6 [Pseudomonadota bacterium]
RMIDVAFKIQCKTLPYDHACDLSKAITSKMPWLLKDKLIGIHTLHGPESGNGWVRSEKEEIFLSKRTRLILRISRSDANKAKELEGENINVLGNNIKIGKSNTKTFLIVRDLISRCVLCDKEQDEEDFLLDIKKELFTHGVPIKKAICGKAKSITINGENRFTRSLMIADLSKENSILLQDIGIGDGRIFGCGIFLPHKSIDAVSGFKED